MDLCVDNYLFNLFEIMQMMSSIISMTIVLHCWRLESQFTDLSLSIGTRIREPHILAPIIMALVSRLTVAMGPAVEEEMHMDISAWFMEVIRHHYLKHELCIVI